MKKGLYIITAVMLLFASCGRQHDAESLVKDFMQETLQKDVHYLSFSDIDSTRALTDSLITVFRQQAGGQFQYQEHPGKTLLFIRSKYVDGQDTCSTTFYMDPALTGIVAFKQN